jgi:hypothetical protein
MNTGRFAAGQVLAKPPVPTVLVAKSAHGRLLCGEDPDGLLVAALSRSVEVASRPTAVPYVAQIGAETCPSSERTTVQSA